MTAGQPVDEPLDGTERSAGAERNDTLRRAALLFGRRRRSVFVLWAALIAAGFAFAPSFLSSLSLTGLRVPSAESSQASALLADRLPAAGGNQAVMVFHSALSATAPEFQAVVRAAAANASAVGGISGVQLPAGPAARELISADGHTALAVVAFATADEGKAEQITPQLVATAQRAATPRVSVAVTGEPALARDLLATLNLDLLRSEAVGLPAALIVLFAVFGGLVAAGLPLLLAMASLAVSLGGFGAFEFASGGSLNMLLESSTEALALGIGIDYALFIVTRFREELARGGGPAAAAATATATAGRTVLVSGTTVVIALVPVLLVNDPMMRELVLGPMIAIAVLVAAALTLLPAVLASPWARRLAPANARSFTWSALRRLGARVTGALTRRPLTMLAATVVPLLALSAVTLGLHTGLDYGLSAVAGRPAGSADTAVTAAFGPGAVSPVQVVLTTGGAPLSTGDLAAVAAVDREIAADPRVASVVSLPGLLGGVSAAQQAMAAARADAATAAELAPLVDVRRGASTTVVTVVPKTAFDSAEATGLVKSLRTSLGGRIRGTDLRVLVGGATAAVADFTDELDSKTALVLALVVALALAVLATAFRSAAVALVGLAGTLLSVGAAYGLLVLVFQRGAGESVLVFSSPGFIQSWLPLLLFATLTGLSTDYQVFLVSRVKEERDAGAAPPEAVAAGLRRSSPVIFAAAAIMIVVFAAFMSADELEVKEMGFALAAVVFIDAAIVRRLMVPAALLLLGDRVWRRRTGRAT